MVDATRRELNAVGLDDPDVVLADAGYWHKRQMEHIVSDGITVLVPPDAGLRKGAQPVAVDAGLAIPDELFRQRPEARQAAGDPGEQILGCREQALSGDFSPSRRACA